MFQLTILAVCVLTSYVRGDPNYRLNVSIIPSEYQIQITPYFATGDAREFTFDGRVGITFTTTEATNQIKFHSHDLTYTVDNITLTANGATVPLSTTNPLEFNTNYSFAFVNLQSNLAVGVQYILWIDYEGPIRDDLNGFYRNYYIQGGVKRWLGATQMEPTHARKVFPCFDEPHLKAIFNIIVDRPSHYPPSLSNTKLQASLPLTNNYTKDSFHPTPRMSTYLVAFLVAEFESKYIINSTNQNEFGVFTRPDAINQTDYAFDFGLKVVHALGDYFGYDYYSTNNQLKLDHIALPNFRAGAMENWGLIKYREALLLYVPEESIPYYKYRVAQIIAHETTHMWFGNLVTCHWWSNTWLNEGFANYFQDYITAMIEPDVYSANMLVTSSVYAALDADESHSSSAITNDNVFSPEEISQHFGTITYQKAGSVIRMIHHLLGDAAFKFGLNSYLTANALQSGYPDLMYTALELGANSTNALVAYNGARVADVMGSWITQAGHPVIDVEVDYDTNSVSLSQRRFYINGSYSTNETYKIPITYTTGVFPNFDNTKPAFIMEDQTHVFTLSENISTDHSWIILNVQETGLYRVKYDSHALQIISSALNTADHGRIHYLSRAKIVNDYFAFFFADEIPFRVLYDVLEFLPKENDFNVWYAAIRGFNKLRSIYTGTDALREIDAYILDLMQNSILNFGYEVRQSDNFEDLKNRAQILELACKLGHSGCLENANANFRNLVENGVSISPSLRPVSYCTGLRLGNASDYDFMWLRTRTTNVANEARTIGEVLGCSNDVDSLNKFLVSMLEEDSPIMDQDLTVPLSGVLTNYSHVQIVIDALNQNLTLWKTIYPSMDTVYTAIAGTLRTSAEIDAFQSWLTSCAECGDVTGGLAALNNVRATSQWAETHKADILNSFKSSAMALPSSVAIIVVCIVGLMQF